MELLYPQVRPFFKKWILEDGLLSQCQAFFRLLARVEITPIHLLPSIGLSLLATFFSAGFYGVVLKLTQGLAVGKFPVALLGICFGLGCVKNLSHYYSTVLLKRLMLMASSGLRHQMFERYLGFGKLYFDRHSSGKLQHNLYKCSKGMSDQISAFHTILSQSLMFLAYASVMMTISIPLTFGIALLLMCLGPWTRRWVDQIKANALQLHLAEENLAHHVSEVFSCLPLIKASHSADFEKERFFSVSGKENQLSLESTRFVEMIRPIEDMIQVSALILVTLSIYFLGDFSKGFQIANLFVFLYLVMASLHSFNAIMRNQFKFARVKGEMRSLDRFFSDEDKVFTEEGSRHFLGLSDKIEFRNLDFSYVPGNPVIQGLSFSIEKGSTVGLIGPTGGGKTTIANLLMRFYDSPAGRILVDGVDIREFMLSSWVDRIAYVGQESYFFNDTIKKNLIYGLNRIVSDSDLGQMLDRFCLTETIAKLPDGIETVMGQRGMRLSGGEKQRLALTRAFLRRSEFVILDEATSALDEHTEKKVQQAIQNAEPNQTTVIISHRLSSLSHVDKLVLVDRGTAARVGSYSEVTRQNPC